jgi:GST-like protein
VITLYTAATGNGYRASILLEELELPYRAVAIDFAEGEQRGTAFLAVSPLGKIPVLVDENGPDGAPITVAESLAIALYLTEKTGRLAPNDARGRAAAWTWGSAVVSGFGASFSTIFYARQLGAEAHAPLIDKAFADLDFQFAALDAHLADAPYIAGESFSWVDAVAIPLVGTAAPFKIDLSGLGNLARWSEVVLARPAVQRGLSVR